MPRSLCSVFKLTYICIYLSPVHTAPFIDINLYIKISILWLYSVHTAPFLRCSHSAFTIEYVFCVVAVVILSAFLFYPFLCGHTDQGSKSSVLYISTVKSVFKNLLCLCVFVLSSVRGFSFGFYIVWFYPLVIW